MTLEQRIKRLEEQIGINKRIQKLEETILLSEDRVSVSKEFKNSEYYFSGINLVVSLIFKYCKKQLQQNPQSNIILDIYQNKPCLIINGSHYPENFVDEIENAVEEFDLYTVGGRDTRVGYVINLSGFN